jgi:TRAP transporter 4TM/12TM fusion protein
MPPIMGAGAFIMAQWTAQPYAAIIAVALLPSLLFFASLMFHVYFAAKELGLRVENGAAPGPERLGTVLREGVHFLVPLGTIIALLATGFSPTYAAGWSIVAVVAASWMTRKHRMSWRDVAEALELGTRNMVATGVLLVCTGLIIGSLNMTGVSVAFSQLVVEWSGGHLLAALVLIALASLILGMGLPVTAAYVMLAVVAVPSLREMGVSLLAAHMIIFWLSQDSNVTPPVCLAAFAGAGVAGSPPMATGFKAWQMSKALYLVPLLFAYTPLIDGTWPERTLVAAFAAAGLFAIGGGISGWLFHELRWWQTLMVAVLGLALFCPHLGVRVAGLAGLAVACAWSWKKSRTDAVKPGMRLAP